MADQETFGILLCFYHEHAISKREGRMLSQTKLAAEVSKKTGLHISRNSVSNWENEKSYLNPQKDKFILLAIVATLYENGGLYSLQEANRLLEAGKYQRMTLDEVNQINFIERKQGSGTKSDTGNVEKVPKPDSENGLVPPILLDALISFLSKLPDVALNGNAGVLLDKALYQKFSGKHGGEKIELYSSECGKASINLAQQRLLVSSSFGAYFAGLLEQPDIYLDLESQIDCPALKGQVGLQPLQRIFWLLTCPNGPRTMVIGGEGGMGKSTLSAKIIRCLYQEQAIDIILGDSAKTQHVNLLSKEIIQYKPGYYDPLSFYQQMCNQLGLPNLSKGQMINAIKDRLVGRKALIVVDNLETVQGNDEILEALKDITSRDVRAIVTTRHIKNIRPIDNQVFLVQLQPLVDLIAAREFLLWHIEKYQSQHPALQHLSIEIYQNENVAWLIERTGGIPLLMQLVLSDVAKYSWKFVQTIPALFGKELLNFLYELRWNDLEQEETEGKVAKDIVNWVAQEQYKGQIINYDKMAKWANENKTGEYISSALSLLYERFLIINRDLTKGNFSIYPSLAEFVSKK